MKCISLWQPWATLIAIGAKRMETRSWSTSYRGPLAIHAAKKWTPALRELLWREPFASALRAAGLGSDYPLPLGAIVCICTLKGVSSVERAIPAADEPERHFGDYSPGRYAWLLADVRRIEPIAFRGAQGFFDVPDELLAGDSPVVTAAQSSFDFEQRRA